MRHVDKLGVVKEGREYIQLVCGPNKPELARVIFIKLL